MTPTLRIALATMLALAPTASLAYVTPEEVLDEEELSVQFFEPPPSKAEAEQTEAAQRAEAARRREEAHQASYDAVNGTQDDSPAAPTEEPLHGAAPSQPQPATNTATPHNDLSERDQRILERIQVRQQDGTFLLQTDSNTQETLHGGAPLAGTGPATNIAAIMVLIAGAITLRRMSKAENLSQ